MDIQLSGLILFNVISCVFGFVVSVILWRYPRRNNYFNRLLAASFLFLTLGQSIGILVQTKAILKVPHLFRFAIHATFVDVPARRYQKQKITVEGYRSPNSCATLCNRLHSFFYIKRRGKATSNLTAYQCAHEYTQVS